MSNTVPDESDEAQAHRDFTSQPHEAKFSHEVIGGAAAYEAMKGYEEHEAANGTFFYPACSNCTAI